MKRILAGLCLLTGANTLAMATETAADEWEFSATPMFLWGVSIDGDATIGGTTAPLDLDFRDDILENVEAVFSMRGDARKGKWALLSEVQYAELDPTVKISQDMPPASVKNDINFTITMIELGAGYAVVETAKSRWELIGGARYNRHELDMDVNLKPPGGGPSIKTDESVDEDWWQGFAGGRLFYSLTDTWTFVGRGDYGYGDSDNTAVNASFFFDYQYNDWGSVLVGYRYMNFDYDNGRSGDSKYAYDATQQGPLLGLTIRW